MLPPETIPRGILFSIPLIEPPIDDRI
jgi:hypothetical protein